MPGSTCVLGALNVWLRDVTVPDTLYEESRFLSDPSYAYFMANLNLFGYLLEHQDGRSGNFLIAKRGPRHVYSIDNGVSMNPWPFYNWFVTNWNKIRVPALRRESIERLRELRREDLDVLAVVDQLERDAGGVYRQAPLGPPLDPDEGVRIQDGTIQFGLKRREIDKIWERIRDLLEEVDEGRIQLF